MRRALQMLAEQGVFREADGQDYITGLGEPLSLYPCALHDILLTNNDDMDRQAS